MRNRVRSSRLLLYAAACVLPHAAIAGRPLDTDDAAMMPRGACQVETFARRERAADATQTTGDYGFAPSCNPFGWGEILIGGGRTGVGAPGATSQGVIQIKGVPTQVTHERPGWGYDIAFEEDFVRGRARPAARVSTMNLIGSVAVSSNWQIDANLGWVHAWAPAGGDRNHLLYGIAAEWSLSPVVTLVGERYAIGGLGRVTQVGATFAVSPRLTLDAAVGRRHGPDSRAMVATVGLTLVSRATPSP